MVSVNGSLGPVLPNNGQLKSANQSQIRTVGNGTADTSALAAHGSTSAVNSTEHSQAIASTPSSERRDLAVASQTKNAVASAVALSVKAMKNADYQQSQVQYDLPEGKSRQAMQAYFDVMSQDKREALSQMLGVDMYV
jgi:hypothetical protein